jgi:hypothetical protein
MDGLSLLDPLAWKPEWLPEHPAYAVGNALGWLSRTSKQASVNHMLSGRLYLSKSGWLLLSVPNALARGVFDALTAPGAELATAGVMNVPNVKEELFNAHISVMTADEVASIGADKINERGHVFHYGLGPIKEITPKNVDGVSKIWAIQVASPALAAVRKSYGLTPLPHGDHQFHITVAVRRKKVLQHNDVCKFDTAVGRGELKAANLSRSGQIDSKTSDSAPIFPARENFSAAKLANDLLHGGGADNKPDAAFSASALVKGKKHEREHTDNDQIAKEIAKDHLQEDPLYYKKVEQIEKASNAYADQLMATPLAYNKDQSVWQNVLSHAGRVKARGDKQLEYQDSAERFRRALVPGYREQAFLQSLKQPQIDAKKPFRERFDKFLEQALHKYGDKALNRLNFDEFNHMLHLG